MHHHGGVVGRRGEKQVAVTGQPLGPLRVQNNLRRPGPRTSRRAARRYRVAGETTPALVAVTLEGLRYSKAMQIVVQVPDALAARLGGSPDGLSAAALEALLVDAYRTGRLTAAELQEALDLPTVDAFDGFLKAHGVPLEYTVEEFDAERALAERLWPTPAGAPRS